MSQDNSFPYDKAVFGVRELRPYQPGKPIDELERELGIPNAIKLASNENALGPSPLALAALRECMDEVALYPDANGFALKHALAKRLGVEAGQITLGNGSNDVLDLAARVFVAPGDEVVYSQYAFLVYALVTQAVGGHAVVVPAREWGHDLEQIAAVVTEHTKLIYVANPNNPTGTYCNKREVSAFLDAVPAQVIVVLDEAYFEYVVESDYPNGLELLEAHSNLIVTRTFSKAYGLAGLRVGYGLASCEITDLLNRVRQPFNVSHVAQAAALAALDDPEHIQRSTHLNQEQMQRVCDACDNLGLQYIQSVGNFVSVEFGPRTHDIHQSLLERGIIVRPVENYGMPNHLRITIGRSREIDQLIDAINALV